MSIQHSDGQNLLPRKQLIRNQKKYTFASVSDSPLGDEKGIL